MASGDITIKPEKYILYPQGLVNSLAWNIMTPLSHKPFKASNLFGSLCFSVFSFSVSMETRWTLQSTTDFERRLTCPAARAPSSPSCLLGDSIACQSNHTWRLMGGWVGIQDRALSGS